MSETGFGGIGGGERERGPAAGSARLFKRRHAVDGLHRQRSAQRAGAGD